MSSVSSPLHHDDLHPRARPRPSLSESAAFEVAPVVPANAGAVSQTRAYSATEPRFVERLCKSYPSSVANSVPIPPGFDDLTPEEKVSYVGALWDRIVADQQRLPISEAQRALLRERLAAHEANPSAVRPWSEVCSDIERTLAARTLALATASLADIPAADSRAMLRKLRERPVGGVGTCSARHRHTFRNKSREPDRKRSRAFT